jgi:hypothetical protein
LIGIVVVNDIFFHLCSHLFLHSFLIGHGTEDKCQKRQNSHFWNHWDWILSINELIIIKLGVWIFHSFWMIRNGIKIISQIFSSLLHTNSN